MMTSIQISVDKDVLRTLDALPEVRTRGRSAVVREAILRHVQLLREHVLDERYRQGYGKGVRDPELEGWQEHQAWPEEP